MKTQYYSQQTHIVLYTSGLLFGLICSPILGQPAGSYFTIPETKLLSSEFSATSWGGTVKRVDALNDTVLFVFSGLSTSSTGVKDNYPVDTVYSQVLPSHGNGDFSNFDGYILRIKNLDANEVWCSLFINTGFTGPSGNPSNDPRNDTFWQSEWMQILPEQTRTLWLQFDSAIPWNIADNPSPHTQGTDGKVTAINSYDRTEISAIGFQIYVQDNPEAAILVAPAQWPICELQPQADLNEDCKVNLEDIAIIAEHWLQCNLTPFSLCGQ